MATRLQPNFQEDIRVSRMNDDMTPKNELEKRILAVQGEQISIDDFMHTLQDAQVFMPVADDTQIKNFQRSS